MKIIKRFNDGTALVQRVGCQPEIIKIEDIKEDDRKCKLTIVSLDGDGFVIEGTDLHITLGDKSKVHVKMETPDEKLDGTVFGPDLMKFLELLQSVLTSSTIAKPSK